MAVVSMQYNRFFHHVLLRRANMEQYLSCHVKLNYYSCINTSIFVVPIVKRHLFISSENFSEKKLEKPGLKITKVLTEDGLLEKKTKIYVPKITLFTPEDEMQVISVDEATKLAKRRNLKLVKISERDPKTDRAVYKLLSSSDYLNEARKSKEKQSPWKSEKMISISSKIAEHDLQAKIKNILKWIEKDNAVRVVVTGNSDNLAPAEKVFQVISEAVGSAGRMVQKICKHGEIKFQVLPPRKPKTVQNNENVKPEENAE